MSRVVVLLGPPGSGKSSIAAALASRLGWRWRDREAELLAQHGGREAFLAVKDEALRALHDRIRAEAADAGPPVIVETTGLSEAAFVDELVANRAVVVRLDASVDAALARVTARDGGAHLTDDVAATRGVIHAYREQVLPARAVDLVIDTETTSIDDAVAAIALVV